MTLFRGIFNLLIVGTLIFAVFQISGYIHDMRHGGGGHMASLEDVGIAVGTLCACLAARFLPPLWIKRQAVPDTLVPERAVLRDGPGVPQRRNRPDQRH